MQIMQLWRFEISAPLITTSIGIYTPRSRLRKGFTSDYHRKHHTQVFSAFLKQKYLFSRPRVFGRHQTGAPDLKGVISSSVFFRINRERLIICDKKSSPYWCFHWDLLNSILKISSHFSNSSSKSLAKQKWPHQGRAHPRPSLPSLQKASRRLLGAWCLPTLIFPILIFTSKTSGKSTLPQLLRWRQGPTDTKPDSPSKVTSSKCSPTSKDNWTSNEQRRCVNARRLL